MKTELRTPVTDGRPSYPLLARHKSGYVVLFSDVTTGTVVHQGSLDYTKRLTAMRIQVTQDDINKFEIPDATWERLIHGKPL